jgi:uncharacterized zinc-type alcohol dehydrogenase-like protein
MLTVNARSVAGPGESFKPAVIERRDLGPKDILIDVAYCGICHSDIHRVRGGNARAYPVVPGHEIAGVVSGVGSEVTRFAIGDRAGVGCMVDSCRNCSACASGQEQFCARRVMTYDSVTHDGEVTHGGYSQKVVVTEDFVLRIPASISLENAAPLFCAGVTMYSPLRKWQVGPGKRVAIVGFGGLGHVGVQLAKAMGAHVSVLDISTDKRDDGLRLGADEYISVRDPAVLGALAGQFDVIVSTVPAAVDLDAYLPLLAMDGTYVTVGASPAPLDFTSQLLRTNRRALAGTVIGGIAETQEMIDFCAEHGVGAEVEIVAADDIDVAFDRVATGDVRFRFVIDASTLA